MTIKEPYSLTNDTSPKNSAETNVSTSTGIVTRKTSDPKLAAQTLGIQEKNGNTPLHVAYLKRIETLNKCPITQNEAGHNRLDLTTLEKNNDILDLLIEHKANITVTNRLGLTGSDMMGHAGLIKTRGMDFPIIESEVLSSISLTKQSMEQDMQTMVHSFTALLSANINSEELKTPSEQLLGADEDFFPDIADID